MATVSASETATVANSVADHYKRRCRWVSADEIEQIVARTVLEAHETYDEKKGPWRNYLRRALRLRLGDELLASSSPVSARRGHRTPLAGHRTVEATDETVGSYSTTPEDALALAQLRDAVRSILSANVGNEFVRLILLDELTYADALAEHGVSTASLAKRVSLALKELSGNPSLRALLEHYR